MGLWGNVTESCHPRIMVDDVGLDLAPYDVTEDTGVSNRPLCLLEILGENIEELAIGARLAHLCQKRLVGCGDVIALRRRSAGHHLRDHPAHQPDLAQCLLIQQQFLTAGARTDDIEGREDAPLLELAIEV